MRISVSDKTDIQADGGRGSFGGHRQNRGTGGGGEERPEMGERWKRVEGESFMQKSHLGKDFFFSTT